MTVSSYRLVLPSPWTRLPLDDQLETHVAEMMDTAMESVPKEIPPDQALPLRRRAEADLLAHLRSARDASGLDAYFPVGLMHGLRVNAMFIVSAAVPDAMADADLSARVTASLLSRPRSRPVTIDDTIWVRTESEVAADAPGAARVEPAPIATFDARRVEYRAPVPEDPRRWITVAFTTGGNGDLTSRETGLVVDLFDAIMGTWRWSPDAPSGIETPGRRAGAGTH